jgi:glycosyltransferase involved in cell wall biosynthesis
MNSLRVLIAHNHYQQHGGEDEVVTAEVNLLRRFGNHVELYERNNKEIDNIAKLNLLGQTFWSRKTQYDLKRLIGDFHPDIIHVHNTLPLISASIYWTAAQLGIPIVQTLHNFRLMCPQGMFLRDGKICEDCLGHLPWRGVVRKCYRQSVAQSAVIAGALSVHRLCGTYESKVTAYIALNNFCRNKFLDAGIPKDKIFIKPNFVDIPPHERKISDRGLFVGRLSAEKGVEILTQALHKLNKVSIDVIGTGPLSSLVSDHAYVRYHGWKNSDQVYEKMRSASYLIMPSIWYENFPRTLVEAFACGLPVIASNFGAMAELIKHGHTGLLFDHDSVDSLAAAIQWAEQNPKTMAIMGEHARQEYENKYTAEKNYSQLMSIYRAAIDSMREEKLCYGKIIG